MKLSVIRLDHDGTIAKHGRADVGGDVGAALTVGRPLGEIPDLERRRPEDVGCGGVAGDVAEVDPVLASERRERAGGQNEGRGESHDSPA